MPQPRLPIEIPTDAWGVPVLKFLDAFEAVRFNMSTEPKFYGYLNPSSKFVIVRHTTVESGDEHLTFYRGEQGETLGGKWTDRLTLPYVEYDEAY